MPLLDRAGAGPLDRAIRPVLEFVDRIDSPMVGLNFDVGHAYCVGEDPQDWVAKMADPHASLSL